MIVIYLLFFLDILNMSFFMTTSAKQLILLGGSDLSSGVLGSTTALVGLFLKPIVGNLTEEKGYKKLLIWCIAPCILGNSLSYLASSISVYFISRLICAAGSPVQTLLRTATTDIAKTNQSDVFNKIAAVCSVSFMLGILVSGHVIGYQKGLEAIYAFIIATGVLSLVSVQLFIPDPSASASKKKKKKPTKSTKLTQTLTTELRKSFVNVKNICLSNKYWDVLLIKTVLDLSFFLMVSNLGFRLRIDYDLDDQGVGYLMLAFSVLSMITNLSLVKIDQIWKNKSEQGLLYGSILIIASFVGLALSPGIWSYSTFLLLIALVKPSVDSDLTKLHLTRIGDDEKGIVFSSFDTVFSLIELISPITSSLIVEYFGAKTNYWFCGLLVVVGLIPMVKRREKVE